MLRSIRKALVAIATQASLVVVDPHVLQHWAAVVVMILNVVGVHAIPNSPRKVK